MGAAGLSAFGEVVDVEEFGWVFADSEPELTTCLTFVSEFDGTFPLLFAGADELSSLGTGEEEDEDEFPVTTGPFSICAVIATAPLTPPATKINAAMKSPYTSAREAVPPAKFFPRKKFMQ